FSTLVVPDGPGLGLFDTVQAVPFQCRIKVRRLGGSEAKPAAQALDEEVTATAFSSLVLASGGSVAIVHFVPFQCRIIAWLSVPLKKCPTAQTLLLALAATPDRMLLACVPPGLGLDFCCQVVPFQCRMRVCSGPPLSAV